MESVENKLANDTLLTQKHKMIYILLGFFSAILLIPGIVFVVDIFNGFQVIKFIIGILLLIFGIAFGVTALIIFLVRMSRNHKKLEKYKELQEQCASEKQYLVELYKDLDGKFLTLSSKIKEFVSNYESTEISLISRLKEDDDYLIQLNNIYNNYKTYQKLEIEFNKRNERSICVKQEYDQIKKSLDSFTKYYLPYVDSFQALKQIQVNFDNYLSIYKK